MLLSKRPRSRDRYDYRPPHPSPVQSMSQSHSRAPRLRDPSCAPPVVRCRYPSSRRTARLQGAPYDRRGEICDSQTQTQTPPQPETPRAPPAYTRQPDQRSSRFPCRRLPVAQSCVGDPERSQGRPVLPFPPPQKFFHGYCW